MKEAVRDGGFEAGARVSLMAALGSAPVLIDLLNDFLGSGPRRDFVKFFCPVTDEQNK